MTRPLFLFIVSVLLLSTMMFMVTLTTGGSGKGEPATFPIGAPSPAAAQKTPILQKTAVIEKARVPRPSVVARPTATVTVGSLTCKVSTATVADGLPGGIFRGVRPDSAFIVVNVAVRNEGSSQADLPHFELVDERGNHYGLGNWSHMVEPSLSPQINPGVETEGLVVFDAPPNHHYWLVLTEPTPGAPGVPSVQVDVGPVSAAASLAHSNTVRV